LELEKLWLLRDRKFGWITNGISGVVRVSHIYRFDHPVWMWQCPLFVMLKIAGLWDAIDIA